MVTPFNTFTLFSLVFLLHAFKKVYDSFSDGLIVYTTPSKIKELAHLEEAHFVFWGGGFIAKAFL